MIEDWEKILLAAVENEVYEARMTVEKESGGEERESICEMEAPESLVTLLMTAENSGIYEKNLFAAERKIKEFIKALEMADIEEYYDKARSMEERIGENDRAVNEAVYIADVLPAAIGTEHIFQAFDVLEYGARPMPVRNMYERDELKTVTFGCETETDREAEEMRRLAAGYRKKMLEVSSEKEGYLYGTRIEMVNNNTIENGVDMDEVADMLTEKLVDLMQRTPDGIYM